MCGRPGVREVFLNAENDVLQTIRRRHVFFRFKAIVLWQWICCCWRIVIRAVKQSSGTKKIALFFFFSFICFCQKKILTTRPIIPKAQFFDICHMKKTTFVWETEEGNRLFHLSRVLWSFFITRIVSFHFLAWPLSLFSSVNLLLFRGDDRNPWPFVIRFEKPWKYAHLNYIWTWKWYFELAVTYSPRN